MPIFPKRKAAADITVPVDHDAIFIDSGTGTLTVKDADGNVTEVGSGGSARATVTQTTASLAASAVENGTVTLAKVSALLAIAADRAARVVLYGTPADRTTDATRPVGTPATPGAGVLAEFVFGAAGAIRCGPIPVLANGDNPAATAIYYAITNRSGAASTVQIEFTHLPLES